MAAVTSARSWAIFEKSAEIASIINQLFLCICLGLNIFISEMFTYTTHTKVQQ